MKQLKFTIYHYFFNHVNLHQGVCHEHFTAKFSLTRLATPQQIPKLYSLEIHKNYMINKKCRAYHVIFIHRTYLESSTTNS